MKKLALYLIIIGIFIFLVISIFSFKVNPINEQELLKNIPEDAELATFAGGCFWCIEAALQEQPGVYAAISGYTGGNVENPSYELVVSGITNHVEAVEIYYNPEDTNYEKLIDVFLFSIDPTDDGGQFSDRGSSYRTAIFYHDDSQKEIAELAILELTNTGIYDKPIVLQIIPATEFYYAEEYHQDYYLKEPTKYKTYAKNSGRADFVEIIKETKKLNEEKGLQLTSYQYYISQKEGTEQPFNNEYWDNKEPGIYVDIISGEPLFSSIDKYDSGTGWPSFTKPLNEDKIDESVDNKLIVPRTKLTSKDGTSLGHVFNDGPEETGGERFCINSASLRFIHKNDLISEGYEEYLKLFE
jgi:peptide methionine sulfoxide reductase msrA/msrB